MYKLLQILKAKNVFFAFIKALIASILFIIIYMFYSSEIIRGNIEDIAFDIVDKIYIKSKPVETGNAHVLIFGVDDLYMKNRHLYDENNQSNYGYLFPRGKIAEFIENLDELVTEVAPDNKPKVLFIDYDMSFTMMPYGKVLSIEDEKLLEVLKKPRPYTILLPKTSRYNFIEKSMDKGIKKLIKEKKIVFVSVSFLQSNDGVVRRYQGYKSFMDVNTTQEYIGVDVALWQVLHEQEINLQKGKKQFYKNDIVGNRIWIKNYAGYIVEDGCSIQPSYWKNLTKYSANCSLFDIVEEEYANSIIMLGGVHTNNDDNFDVLAVGNTETFTGMDMHANALMTMLHLGAPMKRLSLGMSLLIIFFSFFLLALGVSWLFTNLGLEKKELEFIVLLVVNTIVLISISIYLLKAYGLWFNWFVPLVLIESVEAFNVIKVMVPKVINKLRRRK